MDDYLAAFVREGEEHVTDLNNALLELESDPGDEAAMDAIFRTAHTLKGNFAAMGFGDASDLAHAIEDLLDAMRQGDLAVTGERMDRVFAGVDEVEACLDEIEAHGEVRRDVSDTIASVRGALAEADGETGAPPTGDNGDGDSATGGDGGDGTDGGDGADEHGPTAFDPTTVVDGAALASVDRPVYRVRVEMADAEMKAVDGMFVLEEATEAFDLLGADPAPDAIEDGEYGDGFDLVVATSDADVESTVASFPKLSGATVTELDPGDLDTGSDAGDGPAGDADGDESPVESTDTEVQSVHVDVDRLDELHGLVEQLVTTRVRLRRAVGGEDRQVDDELDELEKVTSELQDAVMDVRLVPIEKVVGKFPRLVRDLAREQGKRVDFAVEGESVALDRTILTAVSDPLMHLLRNAVDHGIEPPEVREANGKDPEGTVTLSAERERDRVRIEVSDDGRGIDRDRVRETAVERGVVTRQEAAELTDGEVEDLVFHPGFSTNDEVTDVSGRGVGMDVVRDTVSRLDGSVEVSSEPGEGTTFALHLPVTVAIVTVLFVESGGERYGIPLKAVDEISRMRPVQRVDGEEVVTYDEEVYPLVRLGDALDVPGETQNGDGMLVRIRDAERQVAVHCDDVRGQEEVVVKPFEGILSGIPGLSGAAVLGEGDVVTVLDVEGL